MTHITREEAQYIFSVLEVVVNSDYGKNWIWPETARKTAMERTKEAITLLQSRLAEGEQEPEQGLVPESATPLVLALDKIVEAHKFNIASLPPTEVHAIAFTALSEYATLMDATPQPPNGEQEPWQPIETAPRETLIFIGRFIDGAWKFGKAEMFYEEANPFAGETFNGWVWSEDEVCIQEPTHWMPLPAAPQGAPK